MATAPMDATLHQVFDPDPYLGRSLSASSPALGKPISGLPPLTRTLVFDHGLDGESTDDGDTVCDSEAALSSSRDNDTSRLATETDPTEPNIDGIDQEDEENQGSHDKLKEQQDTGRDTYGSGTGLGSTLIEGKRPSPADLEKEPGLNGEHDPPDELGHPEIPAADLDDELNPHHKVSHIDIPGPPPHSRGGYLPLGVRVDLVLLAALLLAVYQSKECWVQAIVFADFVHTVHVAVGYALAGFTIEPDFTLLDAAETRDDLNSPSYYLCATECSDPCGAQVGLGNHVPRWKRRIELKYVICDETLSRTDLVWVTDALRIAIAAWNGIGVTFKLVNRKCRANFRVVRQPYPTNGNIRNLANAFFPNADQDPNSRTLYIYDSAFTDKNRHYLANVLAHEIGHILGFRHGFAAEEERLTLSATLGRRNPTSVMNYYSRLNDLRVNEQDLAEAQQFYASSFVLLWAYETFWYYGVPRSYPRYWNSLVQQFTPPSVVYPPVNRWPATP